MKYAASHETSLSAQKRKVKDSIPFLMNTTDKLIAMDKEKAEILSWVWPGQG